MASQALPVWANSSLAMTRGTLPRDLLTPDENGLMLPKGFTSRILAETGKQVSKNSAYLWHRAPDGGDIFPEPDSEDKNAPCGWVYVSNAETPDTGGCGAIMFHPDGRVIDSYSILRGTQWNCAGGKTPWGTWLSCEEHPFGRVWECDPWGEKEAKVLPALGIFKHEAAAIDPETQIIYLTEDVPDGLFYRFIPEDANLGGRPSLEKGQLQALAEIDGQLEWHVIEKPLLGEYEPTRYQIKDGVPFNGGEGCVYKNGAIYFTTKGDNKVWVYDIKNNTIATLYDFQTSPNPILSGVDNITVSPNGDVSVAEDGGNLELVSLSKDGMPYPLFRLVGQPESEIAGPAFSPDGKRLYFSSQRGKTGTHDGGITYEITGDFASL